MSETIKTGERFKWEAGDEYDGHVWEWDGRRLVCVDGLNHFPVGCVSDWSEKQVLAMWQWKPLSMTPAPAPSSGPEVKVGTWWKQADGYKQVTSVHLSGKIESSYYNAGGLLWLEGGTCTPEQQATLWTPIPAPPWAKQEGVAVAPHYDHAMPPDPPACGHCKAPGTFPDRVLGKHATRVKLCDPCMVTYERVTFPAGGAVEPVRSTTWAPNCGPETRVRLEMVTGWDKRGRR